MYFLLRFKRVSARYPQCDMIFLSSLRRSLVMVSLEVQAEPRAAIAALTYLRRDKAADSA